MLRAFINSLRTPSRRLACLLLAASMAVTGCAWFSKNQEKEKDEYADWTAEQFFKEARHSLVTKAYEKAIQLYEKLEARYPFGNYATQAQIDVAYAYYKNQEPDSALAAADRFIKLNPSNPHVDYAYYLKGLINYNRGISFIDRFLPTDSSQRDPGAARDAFRDFNELIAKFPRSRYTGDAQKRIIALRNNLAMYELHVADFYMRRGAYLAAVDRCVQIIETYQRTQAVPLALKIMGQAYRKLALNELADDAARVYALNYANGVPGSQLERSPAQKVWDFIGLDR